MRRKEFALLLDALSLLGLHQLKQVTEQAARLAGCQETQALIAQRIDHIAACPHCAGATFCRWGFTDAGGQRYRCRDCGRSFTGLTGTPLCRIHDKHQLLANAQCMRDRLSVRAAAKQLGVHRNTAFRWRHLLMPSLERHQPAALEGVAEADEVFFRLSFKGCKRDMPRLAYRRAMPATKRGISAEQIPVLTALCRGSRHSFMAVLPPLPNTASVSTALGPLVKPDTVLCADSAGLYKPLGKKLGITVWQIPSGSHKQGANHIQNVNALHSRIRGWFRPFKGVATKYLDKYLAWFRYFDHTPHPAKASLFLLDAIGVPT
ncbi:IS1595 family transposase [Crenobacter cavernae]|nr:IS1595 family transposase [Crenobacter cavernae]